MEKISNKEFFEKSSALNINDFITNVTSKYSDDTIEAMFWDIYKEGDKEKIAAALQSLEEEPTRQKLAAEIAEAIINDQQKAD